ncbi:hypothetical protein RI367_004720 [Sorochytrium milnesiophthora]
MTSSLRKAAPRRTHRERAQPVARAKLGLLEKHKDYVLRAKNHHQKQNRLKAMRERASFRNDDEFYFGMINSKTKEGVHIKERNDTFTPEFLSLLKTQDQTYITTQRNINEKKIAKLKDAIHIIDGDDTAVTDVPKAKHTIFVDDEQEAKHFDPAKHFNTHPSLVNRRHNRPTLDMLEKSSVAAEAAEMSTVLSKKDHKRQEKQRAIAMVELSSRLQRSEQLRKVEIEAGIQKALMGKGERQKVGKDANGLPIYKWAAERKK